MVGLTDVKGLLLDMDGVLGVSWRPLPGAAAAVARLRAAGLPLRVLTNTSARGRAASRAAMVGDDVENDVLAAQAVGMTGILVRTGKFRDEALAGGEWHTRPRDRVDRRSAGLAGLLRPSATRRAHFTAARRGPTI